VAKGLFVVGRRLFYSRFAMDFRGFRRKSPSVNIIARIADVYSGL
jgi:hypothetical protein